MPEYYAMVSTSDDGIIPKLCGHLYSRHHAKAHEEAKEYQDQLNGGWPQTVLLGKYHVVTSSPTSTTRGLKGFRTFSKRRVTDKTKWNTVKG